MTGQTYGQGGVSRPVFMTEQEKPVAIFLPQHRPGRAGGPSKAVMAGVMATVVILGSSLFFMMPRGDVTLAPVMAPDVASAAPTPENSTEAVAEADKVDAIQPVQPVQAQIGTPQADVSPEIAVVAAAPEAKAPRAVDIPRKDDPRWARAETRSGSAALEAVRKLMVEKAAQADEGGSNLLAYAGGERSASSLAGAASMTRRPMQIVLPAELPEQPDDATRTASVNAPVNMRKGPGSKHGVLMVIPRSAKVDIYDCDQWCKIGYEGRTGYIYKSFVRGRSS